jgi:hypothetical protein
MDLILAATRQAKSSNRPDDPPKAAQGQAGNSPVRIYLGAGPLKLVKDKIGRDLQ